jgi:hypothetical protein
VPAAHCGKDGLVQGVYFFLKAKICQQATMTKILGKISLSPNFFAKYRAF